MRGSMPSSHWMKINAKWTWPIIWILSDKACPFAQIPATVTGSLSLTIRVSEPLYCDKPTDSNINSSSVTHQIEILY